MVCHTSRHGAGAREHRGHGGVGVVEQVLAREGQGVGADDGRLIGDVIINTIDITASAYVSQSYKSKNKSYKRKADEDNNSESVKDYYSKFLFLLKTIDLNKEYNVWILFIIHVVRLDPKN